MAAAKRPAGINFEKILESMTGDVQEMRREYEESGLPVNDDNQNLHHFSDRLEFLLLFGLRERSILGGRRDLWQYFCKCLADRRNIHDGLKIVKANTELKTGVGRSRCFIRYCLAHQCLGDVIQQCIDNQRVTSHFFDPGALMLDVSLSPSLLSCLYQLCDIVFDLPPTGHDLDVSWPAFARHGTSGSVWQPPSRTMSLSSLSSFTSQVSEAVLQSPSSPISPIMATVGEDEVLPPAIANSSETNALQDRLTLMQEENDSLRVSCAALQLKLDQAQQMSGTGETAERCTGEDHQLHNTMKSDENLTGSSCSQCGFLKEELKQSEDKCIELQHLQQVLETQVQTLQKRVEDFETQETEFKSRIRELENISKNSTSVSEQLVGGDSTHSLHEDTNIRIISKEIERNLGEGEGSESAHVESIGEVQGVVEEFRHKLEVLEKENQALQEQCRLAETEKATLRTNIHKISEVEEKLKQKVASLSKREQEYESLQEDLNSLREKFEERGNLLHITNERLKEVEAALEASDEAAKDSLTRLQEALSQVTESRESHGKLSSDHDSLKKDMEMLQQETTDLRFQLSSQAMELDKAVQTEVEKCKALAKIAELEEAAITQEKDFDSEREQLTSQIAELTKISSDRNRSYSGLQERMQQAETSLEAVHHELSETQSKLDVTQDTSKQLCDDNAQLREKIIQLLREKDALWQANVRLENAAGCGRAWMDNSSASNCLGCGVTFSLTRRRHHCRNCGRIFCTGCSDNWMMTAASSRRVRVCDDCFSVQAELATLVASPALQCVTGPPEDNSGSGVSWEHDGSTLQRRSRTHPLPLGTQPPDDEDFSVISDDEVQNSRLSSSPSSGSPPSSGEIVVTETRATADVLTPLSLSEAPPTNAEVWVGAGTRALVPVDLPVGVALQWNFVSEPKSISFAVLHQPQLEKSPQESEAQDCAGPTQQRILIPTTRVASAKGATVKGRLLTKQPGVYTLVFDNSFSRFTAKKVTYTLRLEMAIASQGNPEAKPSTSSGVSQSSESPHLPMPMP